MRSIPIPKKPSPTAPPGPRPGKPSATAPTVQTPGKPSATPQTDVGEKTLVGPDVARHRRPVDDAPIPVPDVVEASVKVVAGGTVSTFKIKRDCIVTSIGSVREDCDIYINDPQLGNKQLSVIQYGDDFILADCGVQDLATFDGIQARQVICPPGARTVVNMGKTTLMFNSVPGSKAAAPTPMKRFHLEERHDPAAYPDGVINLVFGGREYPSTHDSLTLGSHTDCDLAIRSEGVRPFHALVCWRTEGACLVPLGGAAVIVNGRRVNEPTGLSEDDQIQIGTAVIAVHLVGDVPGRAAQVLDSSRLRFDYLRFSAIGNSIAGSFMVPSVGAAVTVGRSPACHIVIDDGAVSREHAQIIASGKSCQLIDNYSANGCYVNDERVSKVRIRAGDLVEIGRSVFVVHYD